MRNRSILGICLFIMAGAVAACSVPSEPAEVATEAPAPTEAVIAPAPTEAATEAAAGTGIAAECSWAGNGATLAMGDKRLNFDCGGTDTYVVALFGEVTQGDKGWEITQAQINIDAANPDPKNVATVLVTNIMTDDGMTCGFSGTGATTAIDDKRLNFTCGGTDTYIIGLFGDITWGDQGWQITEAQVNNDPANLSPTNVKTVLITKLGVEPE